MKRIAVTGGIAEGKSTVLGYLKELGYSVLSSDEAARVVFASAAVQAELSRLIGTAPPVDTQAVRTAIARDPQVRRQVNRIMHGPILRTIRASSACFVEVPLLIEACLQGEFDRVWVATCGPEEQLRRLAARCGGEESARAMLAMQLPTAVKCAFADRVVRTIGDRAAVKAYVRASAMSDVG